MKKIIIGFVMAIIFLVGCSGSVNATGVKPMFSMIEMGRGADYYIIYHKETKVMYAVSNGAYNKGNFTVLVNADGTPMLWDN